MRLAVEEEFVDFQNERSAFKHGHGGARSVVSFGGEEQMHFVTDNEQAVPRE